MDFLKNDHPCVAVMLSSFFVVNTKEKLKRNYPKTYLYWNSGWLADESGEAEAYTYEWFDELVHEE